MWRVLCEEGMGWWMWVWVGLWLCIGIGSGAVMRGGRAGLSSWRNLMINRGRRGMARRGWGGRLASHWDDQFGFASRAPLRGCLGLENVAAAGAPRLCRQIWIGTWWGWTRSFGDGDPDLSVQEATVAATRHVILQYLVRFPYFLKGFLSVVATILIRMEHKA